MNAPINPFLVRRSRAFHSPSRAPVYARLPLAPRNASPVPHLTSLYHFAKAGEYGDRAYPGNCGGNLIRDLLLYFKPRNVFDPMTSRGTCADVCRELDCRGHGLPQRITARLCHRLHRVGHSSHHRPEMAWSRPFGGNSNLSGRIRR
jgi:hypothetical protein